MLFIFVFNKKGVYLYSQASEEFLRDRLNRIFHNWIGLYTRALERKIFLKSSLLFVGFYYTPEKSSGEVA